MAVSPQMYEALKEITDAIKITSTVAATQAIAKANAALELYEQVRKEATQ